MHVLVTTDTLGGVWTYSRELVSELTARGVRVTLVSFGNIPLPEQIQWMHNLPGLDYRPTAFRLDWMQEGEQDTREAAIYLTELARELNPDLLHLNHLCHGGLPVRIPRVVVAHGDMISWWKTVHGREPKDSSVAPSVSRDRFSRIAAGDYRCGSIELDVEDDQRGLRMERPGRRDS